jgi:hypothetical protein
LYGIAVDADIRLFYSFSEFSSALSALLGGGRRAAALTASGRWDDASTTLRATHIAVLLAPN